MSKRYAQFKKKLIAKTIIQISKLLSFILLLTTYYLLLTTPVYADAELDCNPEKPVSGIDIGCYFGFGRYFNTDNSLGNIVTKLVTPIFSIAAFVVTWYFLWGAWDWILSEGDKQKVADARNKITQAIVGFLILILAFFILPFVLYKLFNIDLTGNFGIIKF